MISPFLIASLPVLTPEAPAPLSCEELEQACRSALLPERLMAQFGSFDFTTAAENPLPDGLPEVYRDYGRFEAMLRDRVARRRAARAGSQFEQADPEELDRAVENAVAQAAKLPPDERERALDRLRWRKLDELALGHDFDFTALCIYRLRLLILLKYRRCDAARGRSVFDLAAERISNVNKTNHQG